MEISRFSIIWAAGSKKGVQTLLGQLFLRLKDIGGADAITALKSETLELRLPSSPDPFILMQVEFGFYIVPPSNLKVSSAIWNERLIHLHEDVIVPIKDKIGGVATGVGPVPDGGLEGVYVPQST